MLITDILLLVIILLIIVIVFVIRDCAVEILIILNRIQVENQNTQSNLPQFPVSSRPPRSNVRRSILGELNHVSDISSSGDIHLLNLSPPPPYYT